MDIAVESQVKLLQSQNQKLLVDFWAPWCGPCRALMPRLEALESAYPHVKFVKINVDENMDYARELGITTVPTIMIYDGETLVNRSMGANIDSVYTNILDTL
jgi:thioredoxin